MSKLSRLRAVVNAVAPEWAAAAHRLDWIDTRYGAALRAAKPEPFDVERAARTDAPADNHQRTRRETGFARSR